MFSFILPWVLIDLVASDIPHCSHTTAIVAQVERLDLDTNELQLTTSVQIALNVRETACFRVFFDELAPAAAGVTGTAPKGATPKGATPPGGATPAANSSDFDSAADPSIFYQFNGSLLYSFTYQSLEQQYPVKSEYEFALPVLAGNCICDCPGGEDHCSGAHEHKNCSLENDSAGICVTTYHPHQPTTGCWSDTSDGELCCQVCFLFYQSGIFLVY